MSHKTTDFIWNPFLIFNKLGARGFLDWMCDRSYLKLRFRASFGKPLDLENPKTFSEKIQWLKLYDRKPEYTRMVDKVAVKDFVSGIIGKEHIIPTLAVYEKVEDIDMASLPSWFVLKCTHDSGGIAVCHDKTRFNTEAAFKKLRRALARDYYKWCREYPYKNVPRRILAEQYIGGKNGGLWDYKFLCFHGKCRCIQVCTGRNGNKVCYDVFDTDWNYMPLMLPIYRKAGFSIPRPLNLNKMIELVENISATIDAPFVRVDMYNVKGRIYFGEITFSPNGLEPFIIPEWEHRFGEMIHLDIG